MDSVRDNFPIFRQTGRTPLVYLDSAATTQKPQCVLDAVVHYYSTECSNIHRGVHYLSERATESYEKSRSAMRRFLNASSENEIVFVRGATEGINLVAQSYGRQHVGQGDEILISTMEHHSNIVPWQLLCEEKGAALRIIPINEVGELDLDVYRKSLRPNTRLVAVTHVSNVLGTVNPVEDIVRIAHAENIPVLIDGAQSAAHLAVDVAAQDCDFFVLSGHKMYGPTGIGVLYGKELLLDSMPPYQAGGDMIRSVTFEKTLYQTLPYKFEAGTPNISGAIGLGAAVNFIEAHGMESIKTHEQDLISYAVRMLRSVESLRLIGTSR
ncbi:MAG: cysteine desulfurase, partial [Acidobacteriota bacterium]